MAKIEWASAKRMWKPAISVNVFYKLIEDSLMKSLHSMAN